MPTLKGSDHRARDRAQAYLDARDLVAEPYLKKYPGKLPKRIAVLIHRKALDAAGQATKVVP